MNEYNQLLLLKWNDQNYPKFEWSQELKNYLLTNINLANTINEILIDFPNIFTIKIKDDICYAWHHKKIPYETYFYNIRNSYKIYNDILINIITYCILNYKENNSIKIYIPQEFIDLLPWLKFNKSILYLYYINVISKRDIDKNIYFKQLLMSIKINKMIKKNIRYKKIKVLNTLEKFFFRPNGLLTKIYMKRYSTSIH